MQILHNKLKAEDYIFLAESVGWKVGNPEQIELALKNSVYTISMVNDSGITIAMGRLIGDGVKNFYIEDFAVHPNYQGRGIGTMLLKSMLGYVEEQKTDGCDITVSIISAKDREYFFRLVDFRDVPDAAHGCGMVYEIR